MSAPHASCETCGTALRAALPGLGNICPACVVRGAQNPSLATTTTAETADTATWADAFPQLEILEGLREDADCPVYLVSLLGHPYREHGVLQIVSGRAWQRAGGALPLQTRAQRLAGSDLDGLAAVLDHGDLADAYFLLTEAPRDTPTLPRALADDDSGDGIPGDSLATSESSCSGKGIDGELSATSEGGESGDGIPGYSSATLGGRRVVEGLPGDKVGSILRHVFAQADAITEAARRQHQLSLRFAPELAFFDEASGQLLLTPLLTETGDDPGSSSVNGAPNGLTALQKDGRLGPFTLNTKIGEGGFGEVWRAQQTSPVKREVALKILKEGFHSQRARTRFKVEQQALARLEHPHIARFIEGGTTPDGRPFFAMEWIAGLSLSKHCHQHEATLDARLTLFAQVCQAIQHAHQKGIIHRDLKSSNVMVGSHTPSVRVIDFGIARSLTEGLVDGTLLTRADEVLGTPAWMSPEQASGLAGSELDVRTDVYGLGVLLYELLTGRLPFDPKQPVDDLRRQIRETDPPKPSSVAETPFAKRLRGDLDWILLKCLEKDPERRYASAGALLRDLERYRSDEPVEASPPQWSYRFKKFTKRNRVAVTAGAMVTLALVAGAALATWGFLRAAESEALAQQEADTSNAINQFLLEDLLVQADPSVSSNRDLKVIEAVDRAAEKVGARFANQPLVEAEIQLTLADIYLSLGDFQDRARHHAERAANLWSQHLGPEHLKTLNASSIAIRSTPTHLNLNENLHTLESIFAQQHAQLGLLHENTLSTLSRILGRRFSNSGDLRTLRGLMGEAVTEIRRDVASAFHATPSSDGKEQLIYVAVYSGAMHVRWIDPTKAGLEREHAIMTTVLDFADHHFGARHPATLWAHIGHSIALMEFRRNRFAFDQATIEEKFCQAEASLRTVLESATPTLGGLHFTVLNARAQLVRLLKLYGDWSEVAKWEREEMEFYQSESGTLSPEALDKMAWLIEASFQAYRQEGGAVFAARRLTEEYQGILDQLANELLAKAEAQPSQEVALALHELGKVFLSYELRLDREWHQESLSLFLKCLEVHEHFGNEIDASTAWTHRRIAELYSDRVARGRDPLASHAGVRRHLRAALSVAEEIGVNQQVPKFCLEHAARLYEISGKREGIDEIMRHWSSNSLHARLANHFLMVSGQFSEAAPRWSTMEPNQDRSGRFPDVHRAALSALMAGDTDSHETLIAEMTGHFSEALSTGTLPLSVHENQGGQFTLLLNHANHERMVNLAQEADALIPENSGCRHCTNCFRTLAAQRAGDLATAQALLEEEFYPKRAKACDLSQMAAESLAAMVYHQQGKTDLAKTHVAKAWELLHYYFSRQGHMGKWFKAPCLSALAIEARESVTGETFPNDHFWRHWEASRAIPEHAIRLIDRGDPWRYLHPLDGVDPAVTDPDFHQTFFQSHYDDSEWKTGREDSLELSGFGYGDPAVVVWETPDEGKRKTAYLRCHFSTHQAVEDLRLRMQCDDGAIVYLDGQEVGRLGIPHDAEESYELMTGEEFGISEWHEERWRVVWIGRDLPPGDHVLTISLHNATPDSSDLRIGNMVLFGTPSDQASRNGVRDASTVSLSP